MGGGEPQLADVLEHLGGISFVYYMLTLRGKEASISERGLCMFTQQHPSYFKVASQHPHPKSCLKGIF